ncbi:DUF4290 domain-containing protein [Tellurirhabdus bombi]|uniref:DUF4290 domain-containing protein n=1 Tax=Tellurirhabdus bombi TaxID=2907205 RepID=UPI001F2CDAC3|nr:DUF4290 domain-containing protein [Tellurirhabdus bombi]
MKEYGSNIQKLVTHLQTIEDREKRTRYAHILVELMRQIHPNMRDNQDYYNKLWDDLYIMSGFTLDVDSPYPPPSPDVLGKKPQQVPYNTHALKHKHYGYNMKLLINKAVSLEDADERRAFVSYLARLMRTFYTTWNKESVEEETILQSLHEMSNGSLQDDIEIIRTNGFVEATPRERTGDQQPRRSTPVQAYTGQSNRDSGHRDTGHRERNEGRNYYQNPNNPSRGNQNRDNRDSGGHRSFRGNHNPNNRRKR